MSTTEVPEGQVIDIPFASALSERYLSYALSTIMARSLPDVRDGLKPVHRRLLYAMRLLKLDPEAGFKKCARVIGDVIGKYHPHGDQSVYDALVRLAQDFALRFPLIDGQGNFGNIDGDNAAAMRYTEARLTKVAKLLMDGLEEESVDFRETYDGEDREPVVLPAGFPNLLANGASGIAVGMATSIPPHNVAELCQGLLMLVNLKLGKRKNLSDRQLVEKIKGPDFPTGGIVVEPFDNILKSYETGRGSFGLRVHSARSWSMSRMPTVPSPSRSNGESDLPQSAINASRGLRCGGFWTVCCPVGSGGGAGGGAFWIVCFPAGDDGGAGGGLWIVCVPVGSDCAAAGRFAAGGAAASVRFAARSVLAMPAARGSPVFGL